MTNYHGAITWDTFIFDSDGGSEVQNLKITVDPRRDNLVSLVLHELLHVYMSYNFNLDKFLTEELEEMAILAWEAHLYKFLLEPRNEKQLESWSKAIERKLQ